ncbi:hypothetical protein H1C71_021551 [Ictidomys tridecemlineatus]|nr:hypothetical protein H1C71_021551 [Ictidomys tridecemlineatus]
MSAWQDLFPELLMAVVQDCAWDFNVKGKEEGGNFILLIGAGNLCSIHSPAAAPKCQMLETGVGIHKDVLPRITLCHASGSKSKNIPLFLPVPLTGSPTFPEFP